MVNPCVAKQLNNMRAAGKDDNTALATPIKFSLEEAMEYIGPDEYVEVTPESIRLRKIARSPMRPAPSISTWCFSARSASRALG